VENKSASSNLPVVSLGKALKRIASTFVWFNR